MLLDALVGNQDRHHENWALIYTPEDGLCLAPTYDHASSLGRNETDAARIERLTTRDAGRSVAHYAARARSGLYETQSSKHPMSTLDAFADTLKISPESSKYWLHQLAAIDTSMFANVSSQIPHDWISPAAIDFASAMFDINRKRLLELNITP